MRIFLEATNRGCKALRKQARRQLLVGWAVPGVCVIAVVFGLMSPGLEATIALVLGVLGLLSQLMALAWIYSIGRQPMWSVLLFPIGTWEVFRIMRWAERTLQRGETVKWGGREYVLKPRGDR